MEALALGLRGYIDTLLPALKCSMDVQVASDNSRILQYVAGYISKWKESYHPNSTFTAQSSPTLIAFKHLCTLSICEPEMWILLSNKKLSWCDSTRSAYQVPDPCHASENMELSNYHPHPENLENLSFLRYLRSYNASVCPPKQYKDGTSVLVGLQYLSIYNPVYFFQFLLMNHPH